MKEKSRTISMQTRADAKDLCVLIESYPDSDEHTMSAVLRFYLESTVEALVKAGADRPLTIADAITRIEQRGFTLSQLDIKNPESRRTRLAIGREEMSSILGNSIASKAAELEEKEMFRKMSEEVNQRLQPKE